MPNNHVQVQYQDDGLVCIRIHRFTDDGELDDELIIHTEAVSWLADAIELSLEDLQTRETRFTNDDIRIEVSGSQQGPVLTIVNRRQSEAEGIRSQSLIMQLEQARNLRAQLGQLAPTSQAEIVLLPPAIPFDLDNEPVALGSAAPGPYSLADGSEAYGRAATVTLLNDGSTQEVGVGGVLTLGAQRWMAMAFESDGSLRLQRDDGTQAAPPVPTDDSPILYPDADMANLWVQWDYAFATWRVDLSTVARSNPNQIADFVTSVIQAGEQTGVMRILQIPAYRYRREDDGPLLPHIQRIWNTQGGPDVFSNMRGAVLESQVAWFDGTGRLFDTAVRHLELILEMDEPFQNALDGLREPWPPISIHGTEWSTIQRASQGLPTGPIELEITLHSDIWFPWINGLAHPLVDYQSKFDNRALAERHTPRLNKFLAEIDKAAQKVGTRLLLDQDECRVPPGYVTDQGVVLNGPEPDKQMTDEDRNASWT